MALQIKGTVRALPWYQWRFSVMLASSTIPIPTKALMPMACRKISGSDFGTAIDPECRTRRGRGIFARFKIKGGAAWTGGTCEIRRPFHGL